MNLRIIVVVLFMTTASIAAAGEYSCSDRDKHHDKLLQKLYFYSLFIEAAGNGEQPPWKCKASDSQSTNSLSSKWKEISEGGYFKIQNLSKEDLAEKYRWDEIYKSFREKKRHIGAYKQSGSGIFYIVCDEKPEKIKHFLTWSNIRTSIDEDHIYSNALVLNITFVDIVEGARQQEGLNMITLDRVMISPSEKENYLPGKITAIPGTNFTKMREIRTSFKDLNGSSCLFEFMAAIAEKFLSKEKNSYALAGHSLGGSVTQYVAQKLALKKTVLPFQAYAFNAIGLDKNRGGNPDNLYSFYIKGDPVVYIGDELGRTQGRNIVQYTPPALKGIISPIKKSWHKIIFKWHRLPGVQEGLCLCMNQTGTLKITGIESR